jgi:hypothetical protein
MSHTGSVRDNPGGGVDKTATIYAGVGFAAWALAIVGCTLLLRKSKARPKAEASVSRAGTAPPSPESGRQRSTPSCSSGSVPAFHRPASSGPQLSVLEGQLRSAIFSAGARERLVQHALRKTNGDRVAAIRKVLNDLAEENKQWG